ncbi:hypothetical protein ACMBCN_02480 [Candidatus Liberibacter asiaticus]|nr:hypothetical protein [Candidatus Liberibacter asiaticus]
MKINDQYFLGRKHHPIQLWYVDLGFLLLLDVSSSSSSSLFGMFVTLYLSMNINLNMFG